MGSIQQDIREIQVRAQERDAETVRNLREALDDKGWDSVDAGYWGWVKSLEAAEERMHRRSLMGIAIPA